MYFLVSTEPDFSGDQDKNGCGLREGCLRNKDLLDSVFVSVQKARSTHLIDPGILRKTALGGGDEVRWRAGKVWWVKWKRQVQLPLYSLLDWSMKWVSAWHFYTMKNQWWLVLCLSFQMKERHVFMCLQVSCHSPVVVLSRWGTLTCTDVRLVITVWTWGQRLHHYVIILQSLVLFWVETQMSC